ncbi:MAG: class IV adenylate cyclase [Candidatus Thorarchaeota archaeon]
MEETYEVEVKFPISDKDTMKKAIIDYGGTQQNIEFQVDDYYDHPCRSFSETDEAFRLRHRTVSNGQSHPETYVTPFELTYKGPKIDDRTKTRIEYTVDLHDSEAISQILVHIGFKLVGRITKHREIFDIEGIIASLDDVTDVGTYIEFELIADGKNDMKKARNRILKLAKTLGLNENDMLRDSYLELYFQDLS